MLWACVNALELERVRSTPHLRLRIGVIFGNEMSVEYTMMWTFSLGSLGRTRWNELSSGDAVKSGRESETGESRWKDFENSHMNSQNGGLSAEYRRNGRAPASKILDGNNPKSCDVHECVY